jgi:hypothetical protein
MRFYPTPSGKRYPSVTSILSEIKTTRQKAALQSWGKKDKAAGGGGMEAARNRGTAVHSMREAYMVHGIDGVDKSAAHYEDFFAPLIPILDGWEKPFHIWCERPTLDTAYPDLTFYDEVEKCVRGRLWSDTDGFAGCPDDIGVWDGEMMLADLKTSKRPYHRNGPRKPTRQEFADAKRYEDMKAAGKLGDATFIDKKGVEWPVREEEWKASAVYIAGYKEALAGHLTYVSACTQLAGYERLVMERLEITPSQWMVVVATAGKSQIFRVKDEEQQVYREKWAESLERFFSIHPELAPKPKPILVTGRAIA